VENETELLFSIFRKNVKRIHWSNRIYKNVSHKKITKCFKPIHESKVKMK